MPVSAMEQIQQIGMRPDRNLAPCVPVYGFGLRPIPDDAVIPRIVEKFIEWSGYQNIEIKKQREAPEIAQSRIIKRQLLPRRFFIRGIDPTGGRSIASISGRNPETSSVKQTKPKGDWHPAPSHKAGSHIPARKECPISCTRH